MKNQNYNLLVTSTNLSDNVTKNEYIGKANIIDNNIIYTEKNEPFAKVNITFNSQIIVISRIMKDYELNLNLALNDKSYAKVTSNNHEMTLDIEVFEIVVMDRYIKVDYAIIDGNNVIDHFIKEFKYKETQYE